MVSCLVLLLLMCSVITCFFVLDLTFHDCLIYDCLLASSSSLPLSFLSAQLFGFCEHSQCSARYNTAINKAMTVFPTGRPTAEDLTFMAEMVHYQAKVHKHINKATSQELEEKLEQEHLVKHTQTIARRPRPSRQGRRR